MNAEKFAEKIGVSRVTLSKVLNGKIGVSPELRKKIEEEIRKHNFVPNHSARNLAGKKNNILGLFLKVASVSQNDSATGSHFSTEFINYAIDEAKKRGYKILISVVDRDYEEISRTFKSGIISGAILLGYSQKDTQLKKVLSEGNKMVLVNYAENIEYQNVKLVNMDDEKGVYNAMEALLRNNHKNILYIGSSQERLPSLRREKGVEKFFRENCHNFENLVIKNGDFTKQSGYNAMKEIFKEVQDSRYPTGVFAANDFMAIGAIEAIKESGLKVPEDISIVGFDDIEISRYTDPPLSTVKCHFQEIAEVTVATLVDLIGEKNVENIQECAVTFVKRDSLKANRCENKY